MKIIIYAKSTDVVDLFEIPVNTVRKENTQIIMTVENRRVFRELEQLKCKMETDDILIVAETAALGLNKEEVANQLDWFARSGHLLVISNMPSTYEFGVSQPTNRAVITTILQGILSNNPNIILLSSRGRKNSGRKKLEFPDNWEELYCQWEENKISSREFLIQSGLKKASFYNMLTEYKELLDSRDNYLKRFNAG